MRGESQKTTKRLAVSGILSALGVVLLWLGSFLQVLDLSMAALASFLVVFAVIEIRPRWAMMIYAVTAVLSLLLLPVKTPALIYALFAGYYPIVKAALESKLPKWAGWVLKLLLFSLGVVAALFLAFKFFTADLSLLWENWWLGLLALPVFVLYDIAMTRLISAYLTRWRHRFRFLNLH